ncbi:transcription elongation factor SPT6-like [Cotesia glomerata]|uniref:transcription elongation factor SPT6-like n=1 Tax=Cotesia glomerata TaxID=32391 RepID=UPI001D023771|nr:transcription elongation factor SPT6-like [Cotesia glomerata]
MALRNYVIPDLKNELRTKMTVEAKEAIMYACCQKLDDWIKFWPYTCTLPQEFEDDDEWSTKDGFRSIGIAYVPDLQEAAFASAVLSTGTCYNFLKMPHLLKRMDSFNQQEKWLKEADMLALKNFIEKSKPHVIVVTAESKEALMIYNDVKKCLKELNKKNKFPLIQVELCDPNVAKIYSTSNRGITELPSYPPILRVATSLVRRILDPLGEFAQLCNADQDLLCLRFHPLQDLLNKEELLTELYYQFVNRVNEVGVDVNNESSYTGSLLQFISGLGPRKTQNMLKLLKHKHLVLNNRTELVHKLHFGPTVFINCAGFIKIDGSIITNRSDVYQEPLDETRIHPKSYEWANKMAIDALEDGDEDMDQFNATERIMKTPHLLDELDLEAFAEQLKKSGFSEKLTTLLDIKKELKHPYKDMRRPYQSLSAREIFNFLTKETPETFYVGKLVQATVVGFHYKKPKGKKLDQSNPIKNNETETWQCPFCLNKDFLELSEVWSHFDSNKCPGKAVGVRLRLENGLSGYIHLKNLSSQPVENPEDKVRINQMISCQVVKVDVEKFGSECSSKSTDLADVNNIFKPAKDHHYDHQAEEEDKRMEKESQNKSKNNVDARRVIVHPSFHNITFAEAEKMMQTMDPGECVIRLSSKGVNRLSITWKIVDDIYQHIDVVEEDKPNAYSLGRSLYIGAKKFDDLDEIIARYINVMAGYIAEVLKFKYYCDDVYGVKHKSEEILREQKKINPKGIPYILSAAKTHPGKFVLSYIPRSTCYHEYFSVTTEGFKFRNRIFINLEAMIKWFKQHFRGPIAQPQQPLYYQPTPINTVMSTRKFFFSLLFL